MSRKGLVVLIGLLVCGWGAPAIAREAGPAITDREIIERLTRLEEGQKSLQKQITAQGESLQNQINGLQNQVNDLRQTMMAGFGILFAGMMGLIGFILWDRRTVVAPVQRTQRDIQENQEQVAKALREYARQDPRLAGILKSLNLM